MSRTQDYFLRFARRPLVLVDVGALGGLKAPWRGVEKMLSVIAFEPQSEGAQPLIERGGIQVGTVALGDRQGRQTLHLTKPPDGSSLLEPNTPLLDRLATSVRYQRAGTEDVQVDTLDAWRERTGAPAPDFLKIDTQGTELAVLQGAEKSLSSVMGAEIEVNFYERYKGNAFFSDVDSYMRARGFWLFDLQRRYSKSSAGTMLGGRKGQLTHGNALYLRSIPSLATLGNSQRDSGAHSLALISAVYGYFDYAREVLSAVESDDVHLFFEALDTEKSIWARISDFPGRYRIARFFKKVGENVEYYSSTGSAGDSVIGNE